MEHRHRAAEAPRRSAARADDLVLAAISTVTGPLLWWIGTRWLHQPIPASDLDQFEQLTGLACAVVGGTIVVWWVLALLGTALTVLGLHVRSRRMTGIGVLLSPAFLRRVAGTTLGLNLLIAPSAWAGPGTLTADPSPGMATAVVAAAHVPVEEAAALAAAGAPPVHQVTVRHRSADVPYPGGSAAGGHAVPTADTPAGWSPAVPDPPVPGSTTRGTDQAPTVTVRHGDCLWDIAGEELGPYATDLEVDRRWRRWHHHNLAAIGPDPGQLRPGTVLVAPPFD